jgi:hypothetical protein
MIARSFFGAAAIGVFAVLGAAAAGSAAAQAVDKPTLAETMDELSRFTGLAEDTLSLVHGEAPQLFEPVNNTVFVLKVIGLAAEAKDQEAVAEIVGEAVDRGLERIEAALLPASVGAFFTVVSAYKAALEIIRDYIFLPAMDQRIWEAYRKARAGDAAFGDTSRESRETAFSIATTQGFSGYYALRDSIFDEMIKAKKYNRDAIGPEMEKRLRRQIDDFWIARLETRFQAELLKAGKEKAAKETWAKADKPVKAIVEAAAKVGARIPGIYFATEKDVPKGWRRRQAGAKSKDFAVQSFQTPMGTSWHQTVVVLSDAYLANKKENRRGDGSVYYTLPGGNDYADPSDIHVSIIMHPNAGKMPDGQTQLHSDNIRFMLTDRKQYVPGYSGPVEEEGVEVGYYSQEAARSVYHCMFVKGAWYVVMSVSSATPQVRAKMQADAVARYKGKPGDYVDQTVASEALLRQFVKAVAARIPGRKAKR